MPIGEIKSKVENEKDAVVPLRPSIPSVSVDDAAVQKKADSIAKKIHSPKKKDTTLNCRYELKYRIRESKAQALAHYIKSYIAPDTYSRKCPNYEYPISSLYMDSDRLNLARETLERKTNRYKLRIRCYDDRPDTPCFFEIKRRLNSVILKDRARVSKDMVARIIRDNYVPDSMYKKDQETLRQFQFYVRSLCARPIVLVRYMRQAFEGDSSNRVRITFDRQLSFKTVREPLVTTNGPGWKSVPMDFVVLEIKFTARYPIWISEMVKIFDLKQTSMSKYVSTVKQSCDMGFCAPSYMENIYG